MFGKNIKKIRGVKGLTQQAFAEIFGLKRATLAAYEEGRSNPRVETVIKIAEYYGLEMDELMKKELTVNRLLAFQDYLTTQTETLPAQTFCSIPCLTEALEADFVRQGGQITPNLPVLQLPLPQQKGYLGYTVHAADMVKNGRGFLPKDIVIGFELDPKDWSHLPPGTPVLALSGQQIILRLATFHPEELRLHAHMEGISPLIWPIDSLKKIWEVRHVFHYKLPVMTDNVEQRLLQLENKMKELGG